MIITRTPYRISFVGGGTDLKSFYKYQDGQVISATIDKYLYVVARRQLGFVEYKYRINWSKVEFCNSINSIKHTIVRSDLRYFKINYPLEITTFADIPARQDLVHQVRLLWIGSCTFRYSKYEFNKVSNCRYCLKN